MGLFLFYPSGPFLYDHRFVNPFVRHPTHHPVHHPVSFLVNSRIISLVTITEMPCTNYLFVSLIQWPHFPTIILSCIRKGVLLHAYICTFVIKTSARIPSSWEEGPVSWTPIPPHCGPAYTAISLLLRSCLCCDLAFAAILPSLQSRLRCNPASAASRPYRWAHVPVNGPSSALVGPPHYMRDLGLSGQEGTNFRFFKSSKLLPRASYNTDSSRSEL